MYYIKEKRVERERVCHFDNDTPSFFPSVTFYISIISRLVIVPFKNFSCVQNSRVAQDFIPSLDFEIIIKICIYISMECYIIIIMKFCIFAPMVWRRKCYKPAAYLVSIYADLNLKRNSGLHRLYRWMKGGGESFGTVPSLHQICSSTRTSITSRKSSLWLYAVVGALGVPSEFQLDTECCCCCYVLTERSFGSLELPTTTTNQTAILMIISCLRFNELPMMERAHSQLVPPESSVRGYDSRIPLQYIRWYVSSLFFIHSLFLSTSPLFFLWHIKSSFDI